MARPFGATYLVAVKMFEAGFLDPEIAVKIGVSRARIWKLRGRWKAAGATPSATVPATDSAYAVHIAKPAEGMPSLDVSDLKGRDSATLSRNPEWTDLQVRQVAAIVESLEHGASKTAAFEAAGVPKSTGFMWERRDLYFRQAVSTARGRLIKSVAGRVYEIAMNGPANVAWLAGLSLLERVEPADWSRQQRVQHEVHLDGGIDVRAMIADPKLIDLYSEAEARLQNQSSPALSDGELAALPAHEELQ